MVERGVIVKFETIGRPLTLPAGRFKPRPRDDSGRKGRVFAEGSFRGWRGRMRYVYGFGCGRGTHGGGLHFSELRDVVLLLKAGPLGASGEAQYLCACLASPARADETFPTRGLRKRATFRFFPGRSMVFRSHHGWHLQRMNRKKLQRNSN
jgi:hypothetical protein